MEILINKWYHVVVVKKKFNYTYFVNGNLDKTSSVLIEPISVKVKLKIGAIADNREKFNGKIDDIRIYNLAITPAEITFLATN